MTKRFVSAALAAALGFAAFAAPAPSQAQSQAADRYWQCVPFARLMSGIQIFGDAWTWWRQASDSFRTSRAPETGSVLVFEPHGRMRLGHVAVVSEVLTDRVIHISHANWGGSRGKIEENVTVVDVSRANDWSQVKVWYNPIQSLGSTTYPTYGFIHNDAEPSETAPETPATLEQLIIASAQ
jgi:surface antigen